MSSEEFVLAMVAIVMGSGIVIVTIAKITGLIKSWMNRKKTGYDEETFERLAKAFMKHKEQSEKRFRKLESLLKEKSSVEPSQIETPKETIEIEDQEEKTKEEANDGNLNNMLRE